MYALPTNIDTTYADTPGDPTVKLHQQYHDSLHQAVDNLGAKGLFSAMPLASSVPGGYYLATDLGNTLFVSDGVTWDMVNADLASTSNFIQQTITQNNTWVDINGMTMTVPPSIPWKLKLQAMLFIQITTAITAGTNMVAQLRVVDEPTAAIVYASLTMEVPAGSTTGVWLESPTCEFDQEALTAATVLKLQGNAQPTNANITTAVYSNFATFPVAMWASRR